MQVIPETRSLEPVIVTPYEVTGTPQTIDPYAIDVAIDVPSGTVATIQTDSGVTFNRSASIVINGGGRAMTNTFIVSRASGSGTILVLISRVAGRAATNA